MKQSNPLKTANTIGLISGIALMASPFAFRHAPAISQVVYPLAGLISALATDKGNRDELEQAENPAAYFGSGLGTIRGLMPKGTAAKVRKVAYKFEYPIWTDLLKKTEINAAISQAFKDMHSQSFLIITQTNGGKTFALHQSAGYAITELDEHVVICDRSYGKRGQTWHNLPVADLANHVPGCVYMGTPDELEFCVEQFYQERERRATLTKDAAKAKQPTPTFRRWSFYLPERAESLKEYESICDLQDRSGDYKRLTSKLDSLFRDGHGYNIFIRSDAQSAATGEVDVSEAMRNNLNWWFLGVNALNPKELSKVNIDKAWVGKLEQGRKQHGQYLGVALIAGMPQFIKAPCHEYDFSDAMTHDQAAAAWLAEHRDNFLALIKSRIEATESCSPSAMFDACKAVFPSGFRNKGKDNPYWQSFKSFVENQETNQS
jgi:hypothetical protein